MMETNHSFLSAKVWMNMNQTNLDYRSIQTNFYAVLPFFNGELGSLRKVAFAEVAKSVTTTAIAIKRYQLQHNKLPDTLDKLMPEFLAAVPLDPIDGQPLRYRPNADGRFLLYSIGENGKDDGGDPLAEKDTIGSKNISGQNPYAHDWVWPQLATEAEIQKYDEEQAKKAMTPQ
ncbi:MAG TPA: hypothetical protein VN516_04475, partial [Candidatus Baltobacteraceae bacterium]|nr:hypothetical protein [Candidatus Baltobacteraceae bacterium]